MTTTYEAQAEQLIAAIDAVERDEPECECIQTDADQFDNRRCCLCNPQSAWNRELRTLQGQLKDVQDMARYQASGEAAWVEEEDAA